MLALWLEQRVFHTVLGDIVFVPCILELQMYGSIYYLGMGSYPPRVGLARVGSMAAVRGFPHRVGRHRPGGFPFSSLVCKNCRGGRISDPGMGTSPPRVSLTTAGSS